MPILINIRVGEDDQRVFSPAQVYIPGVVHQVVTEGEIFADDKKAGNAPMLIFKGKPDVLYRSRVVLLLDCPANNAIVHHRSVNHPQLSFSVAPDDYCTPGKHNVLHLKTNDLI